jgi:Zn-dependent M28 family amino/carboxypeptidase
LPRSFGTEKLTTRVRFVWFDMEELGLVGSTKYMQMHATDRIAAGG